MLVSKPRSKESYISKETLELLDERRTQISNKGDKEDAKTINVSKKIKEMRKTVKEKMEFWKNIKRTGRTKRVGHNSRSNRSKRKQSRRSARNPCLRGNLSKVGSPRGRTPRRSSLSPTLFNAVLEHIFRQLNHLGLNINGARLNHLRFADDLVLLEEDPAAIEQMMQSLANESREVGLEINGSKTRLMTNSRETDVIVDGNKIEYVKEYIYLGQIISPSDEMTKEINMRITQGWRKYWSLKEIVKSKDLGNHINKKTFDTCIISVLAYLWL
ncbi:Putative uncharacterized transposon-derived protein F52C9.6 [Eumeta japonica]|uniref:Uncharacterized transposon-derived protein F52C9.6 n=1 Tax=Eumeta variegata TaxID=151549 RepID=A0A4C1T0C2_EUMVA|nr:Putative uncharacterized transposon-derived protein F52C9.6 [Eumeta japonica]